MNNKKKIIVIALAFFTAGSVLAQNNVGIGTNTPASSAKLDINATDKGLMIPQVALTAKNLAGPITSPATSLMVYNTATANTGVAAPPNDITPGYYYNAGTSGTPNWVRLTTNGSTDVDWIKATTASTPAVKTDDQYVTGKVGIGDFSATAPSQKLEVAGSIIENAENSALGIDAQAAARLGFIKKSGVLPMIASDNGNPIIFAQSNQTGIHTSISTATLTERMRIDGTNGYVGIGNSPSIKLHVNGGLATTPSTAAGAANIAIPANISTFYITNATASTINAVTATGPVEGQYLTIVNLDADAATFAGATIPATTGVGVFQYVNIVWRVISISSGTNNNWTKATTASTPAVKTDNQYVTGNVGIGDFSGTSPLAIFQTKRGSNGGDFTAAQTTAADIVISGLANGAPARLLLGTNNSTGGTTTGNQIEFWANSFGGGMGKLGQISTASTQGTVAGQTYGNLLFSTSNNDAAGIVTEKMRITNAGDVGIGTTVPYAKLDVDGNIYTSIHGNNSQHDVSEQGTTYIGMKSGNTVDGFTGMKMYVGPYGSAGALNGSRIGFQTWGNSISTTREVVTINEYGNVGIGTTTPADKLHVFGNSAKLIIDNGINATSEIGIVFRNGDASASQPKSAIISKGYNSWKRANMHFVLDGAADDGPYDLATDTKMIILAESGNVGIGTTGPVRKLEVNNVMKFTNGSADANDGIIGTKTFDEGLNIVGINTDATSRKISMWGGIRQIQNDVGNYFKGHTYFSPASGSDVNILPTAGTYLRVGSASAPVQDFTSNFVYVNSRVHIGGTGSVDYPLFVEGSCVAVTVGSARGSYYSSSYGAGLGAYGPATDISGKFIGRVWATTSFEVSSDIRIKNIIGKTNNEKDLNTLKQIEIVDYTMKDKIAEGNKEFKKVIAQDVAKVYPTVVTYATDIVPDIFALYPIIYNDNNATVLLDKSFDIKVGDKIRLMNEFNAKMDIIVTAVANNTFSFVPPDNINRDSATVFVYGREVNDKALVDYDGLTTLNISATQELAKQLEDAKAEIELLKKQNEALKTTKASTTEVDQLKAQVEELKKLILNTALKAEK